MIDVSKLPPGPWEYMTLRLDDWGKVRTPDKGLVADTCPGMNGSEFSKANPEYGPVRKAGPPEAREIAALLIWARAIIEPPPEVLAAMERMNLADNGDFSCYISLPGLRFEIDKSTVAGWTLKIFAEVLRKEQPWPTKPN